MHTKLLGRFAPIFKYLNCERGLIVNIVKQRRKNFADFQDFKIFTKIKNLYPHIFLILIIHKLSLGSREVQYKIWVRSVEPFWRLSDTNGQTGKVYTYLGPTDYPVSAAFDCAFSTLHSVYLSLSRSISLSLGLSLSLSVSK